MVINDAPVKQVSVSKSLGVKTDQNLKWDGHVQLSALKTLFLVKPCSPFITLIFRLAKSAFFRYNENCIGTYAYMTNICAIAELLKTKVIGSIKDEANEIIMTKNKK